MSFEDMTKKQLIEVAETFGVDYKTLDSKATILQKIEDDHVTYDSYVKIAQIAEEEAAANEETRPKVVSDDETALVKFVGKNASYEIRGHVYTPRHPFNMVNPDDADYLVKEDKRFVMATPGEAADFYA